MMGIGFISRHFASVCVLQALLIAALGVQTPLAIAEMPRPSDLVAEGRIRLPNNFYKDGDLFRLRSDQNWYSMFFKSESFYETWDSFARGYFNSTGKNLSGVNEISIETISKIMSMGRLNALKFELSSKGYDIKFSMTPINHNIFPISKIFSDMCGYYAYEVSGITSPKAFPDKHFTTRAHHLICVIYDYDRARFHIDLLELSERYAPFEKTAPEEGLEALAAQIFSTLLPPPEFR